MPIQHGGMPRSLPQNHALNYNVATLVMGEYDEFQTPAWNYGRQMIKNDTQFTNWTARPGWLILLPSRTAPKSAGGLFIPETETKKTNSGICIKAGTKLDEEIFLGKECFFANHTEYGIKDTETDWELYVIDANKILMLRTPPAEVAKFSREKGMGLSFETITHDQT